MFESERIRCTSVTYRVAVRARVVSGIVIAVALASIAALSSAAATAELKLDGVPFRPELALTSGQQQRGLMFRKKAPADGMLFVFSRATSGGFWMKNTLVPLTIVYYDTAGRRVRRMSMTPCRKDPCRIYDPDASTATRSSCPQPIRGLRDASALRPSSNVSSAQRAKRVPVRLAVLLVALLLVPAAAAQQRPVVVIDPGHDLRANTQTEPIGPGSSTRKIKDGGGTRGVVSGLREADLDLRVSLRLRTLLERAGVRVVMTRTETAGTSIGNIARARIANRAGAALFLRVHADGSTDSTVRGTHTLYPAMRVGWTDDIYAESKRAARIVQADLRAALDFPDRGLQERADFTGFNWADVPVILVEMGFMTNPTEDRLLATAAYQRRAAIGLCRGALRFLGRSVAACR